MDEEKIMAYILTHTNEDFPMDQTLADFNKKVERWSEEVSKYGNSESNDKR